MNILFDVYDSSGGLAVDTTTVITYDTTRFLLSNVSLSSGEIQIKLPESKIIPPDNYVFLLLAKVTLDVSNGNNRTQSKAWIEADTGSDFQIIPGTINYMYNREKNSGWDSASINSTFQIEKTVKGSIKFRVLAEKVNGSNSLITVADASNFIGIINNP